MAVFKRGKKWVASVYVGQGKRVWKSFSRQKEAQKFEREVLLQRDQGVNVSPEKKTFGEFLQEWLDLQKVKPKTLETYKKIAHKHLFPSLGSIPLSKLQPLTIEKYFAEKSYLATNSLIVHLTIIRKSLNDAVKWKLIPYNPANSVASIKRETTPKMDFDVCDVFVFLHKIKNSRYYVPAIIAMSMGLRLGEVLGLFWKDINIEKRYLAVNRTIQSVDGKIIFVPPKSKSSERTLIIPKFVVLELLKQKKKQAQNKLILGPAYEDHDLVFCKNNGKPYNPVTFSGNFSYHARKHNLANFSFHALRHINLTLLVGLDVNFKKISEWAGHTDTRMLDDVYTHVNIKMMEDIADKIDSFFSDLISRLQTR